MQAFKAHTIETAPEKSKPALQGLKDRFGLIPNLAATMAESPVLIGGFVTLLGVFGGGTFTGGERQVLLLTNAVTNKSSWAVAFHSAAALGDGIAKADVDALREGRLPVNARLAALSKLTKTLIEKRGHLEEKEVVTFIETGFSQAQLFEVVAGVGCSTMANYAGNFAKPTLDEPFKPQAWIAS